MDSVISIDSAAHPQSFSSSLSLEQAIEYLGPRGINFKQFPFLRIEPGFISPQNGCKVEFSSIKEQPFVQDGKLNCYITGEYHVHDGEKQRRYVFEADDIKGFSIRKINL